MSYILDALKKSEKERTLKRKPSVDALQNALSDDTVVSLKGVITLVLAIAIANAVAIYLFFPQSKKEVLTLPPPSATMPTNSIPREDLLDKPLEDQKLSKSVELDKVAARVARRALPALPPILDVTAHIYADDPDLRMVKIDGVNRNEGDYLAENHQLVEITSEGIILDYYGQRYNLNVVEDWQID